MIMLSKFKYDYNNKLFIINLLLALVFAILSIVTFEETTGLVWGLIMLIMAVLAFINGFFIMRAQGIKIKDKKDIVIVDDLLIRKIRVDNISYVSIKQIPKKTKSKTYGFLHEFFHPGTYMTNCNYVYNQGKVYDICFRLKDGTIVTSYFGWLYRAKEKTVNKVEKKLLNFINEINMLCRENRNKK